MDKKNLADFPKEGLSKNPVNVIYFQKIYVAASSLNVKELFDSKWKKKKLKNLTNNSCFMK